MPGVSSGRVRVEVRSTQRVAAWMQVAQEMMYFRRRVNWKIVTSLSDCDYSSGRPSLQIRAFSRRFVHQRAAGEGQSVAMRMLWNVIVRTHLLLRVQMPTNVLPGTIRSRSVLSWGVRSRLLPHPVLADRKSLRAGHSR